VAKDEGSLIANMTLGQSSDVLNARPNSPLTELLQIIANDVISDLQKKLDEYDVNASSRLKQSMVVLPIATGANEVSVQISAEGYWKFINYGVNGTAVNHGAPSWGTQPQGELTFKQAIEQWIGFRGIQLPPQFGSYDSFAFAIMNKVKRDGKKPRPFYSDVVNERLIQEIKEPIEALFGRAITVNIVEPWQ
jgi:hypothetical protein